MSASSMTHSSIGQKMHGCADLPLRFLYYTVLPLTPRPPPVPPSGGVTRSSLTLHLELFISVPVVKSSVAARSEDSTSRHCFLPVASGYSVPMLNVITCIRGWKNETVVFVCAKNI